MTEIQPAELSAVIAGVELKDVRLVDSSARTRVREARTVPNAQLVTKHATSVIARFDDGFTVGAMAEARIISPGEEATDNPPVRIGVTFALHYALPDAARFSDAVLEEFARVNGAFNAWPYWREYVQTTAARMNLPPVVMPVFRVIHTRAASAEQPARREVGPSSGKPSGDVLQRIAASARKKR